MPVGKTDLTLRADRSGHMVTSKNNEYITNIVQMLFATVPGTDAYSPDKGLDIYSHSYQTYTEGQRDTTYETEISKQFNTYTDLIPKGVTAIFVNNTLLIIMIIQLGSQVYNLEITKNETEDISVLFTN